MSKKERRHAFNAEWLWRHRPKPMFEAPDRLLEEYFKQKGFNDIYQQPIFTNPKKAEAWKLRLLEIRKEEEALNKQKKQDLNKQEKQDLNNQENDFSNKQEKQDLNNKKNDS